MRISKIGTNQTERRKNENKFRIPEIRQASGKGNIQQRKTEISSSWRDNTQGKKKNLDVITKQKEQRL